MSNRKAPLPQDAAVVRVQNILSGKMKKNFSPKKAAAFCAVSVLMALVIWTVWGNTALMESTVTISSSRIPPAFSGFCIAQISDLHNAEFGKDNSTLLRMLSESEPDMIVITGDLVDSAHTDIDTALAFATEAVRIAPVYYVTGNHEARLTEYNRLRNGLETAGVTVLEDQTVWLERDGEKILLIGLSDPNFAVKGDMFGEVPSMVGKRLESLTGSESSYTILLSHRPELFATYVDCGIDLVLSGHAHGGQFRLPFIGGLVAPNQGLFPEYDAGLYTDGSTNMIVSRGIGNSIIPLRFNNRPEIVLAELCAE